MNLGFGDERLPATPAIPAPPVPGPGEPPRVIVADDEPLSLRFLQAILKAEGCEVEAVDSGDAALAAAERATPHIVVLDAHMPGGINGFQACRSLRERPATRLVPVMMVTALTETTDRHYGLEVGVDDYVCKPYRREEVRGRVRSLLERQRVLLRLSRVEDPLREIVRMLSISAPHSERVARLAGAYAEHGGAPPEIVRTVARAGFFHDVGKLALPETLIGKTTPLDAEEEQLLRFHPERGHQICRGIPALREVLSAIRWHHERFDGLGFPDNLKGRGIPRLAREIAVVSVFDAIGSNLPPKESITILDTQSTQGWWDPEVVARFIEMIEADGPEVRPTGWTGLDRAIFNPPPPTGHRPSERFLRRRPPG